VVVVHFSLSTCICAFKTVLNFMTQPDGSACQHHKLQVEQQEIIMPSLELAITMGKELAKWERSYLTSGLRMKTLEQ